MFNKKIITRIDRTSLETLKQLKGAQLKRIGFYYSINLSSGSILFTDSFDVEVVNNIAVIQSGEMSKLRFAKYIDGRSNAQLHYSNTNLKYIGVNRNINGITVLNDRISWRFENGENGFLNVQEIVVLETNSEPIIIAAGSIIAEAVSVYFEEQILSEELDIEKRWDIVKINCRECDSNVVVDFKRTKIKIC